MYCWITHCQVHEVKKGYVMKRLHWLKCFVRDWCLFGILMGALIWVVMSMVLTCFFTNPSIEDTTFWSNGNCLITFFMIWLAYVTYKETRCINENIFVCDFLKEYAKEQMCEDIRTLRNLLSVAQNGEKAWLNRVSIRKPKYNMAEAIDVSCAQCETLNERRVPWSVSQDAARRRFKFWYLNVYNAYSRGLISKNAIVRLLKVDGTLLLFQIIEPMEYLINPSRYEWRLFYEIMELFDESFYHKIVKNSKAHKKKIIFEE